MRLLLCAIALTTITGTAAFAQKQPDVPMTGGVKKTFVPYVATKSASCNCIDMVLVIDDTGSMGGTLTNVKAGIVDLINLANTVSCDDLQLGLVTFKNDTPTTLVPLAGGNAAAVVAAINGLTASGGNNLPEASDEALRTVFTGFTACSAGTFNTLAFRDRCCKITILATDAVPGGCDDAYTSGIDDVNAHLRALEANSRGIKIGALQVANNFTPLTEIMQDYAATTGGLWGLTAADGTGATEAMKDIVNSCAGTVGVLCCSPTTGCFNATSEGNCLAAGGITVGSCAECATATTHPTWGWLKTIYHK